MYSWKWLDYSTQGHRIVHLSCRAHTAVALEFGAGGDWGFLLVLILKLWAAGRHGADRLQSSFSLRDVHGCGQFTFTLNLQCFSFWLLGCIKIDQQRLAHIGQAFCHWPAFPSYIPFSSLVFGFDWVNMIFKVSSTFSAKRGCSDYKPAFFLKLPVYHNI